MVFSRRILAVYLLAVLAACSGNSASQNNNVDASVTGDGAVGDTGPKSDAQSDGASNQDGGNQGPVVTQWKPFVVAILTAAQTHRWDDFPLQVTFTHEGGDAELNLDGYWVGGNQWAVRFAATKTGVWTWVASTDTGDPGLAGSGSFTAVAPSSEELAANANYHGHVRISGQYFQYADRTPFLLLGDTFWLFNSVHTYHKPDPNDPSSTIEVDRPLGDLARDFDHYVDDRVSKGFNAVLVEYLPAGSSRNGHTSNGGGYLWDATAIPPAVPVIDWSEINPAYFEPLDTRVEAFWNHGLVILGHPRWIGTTPDLTVDQAVNLSHYLLARYGAYNIIWSLTGEFHDACGPKGNPLFCDNEYEGIWDLGRWVGGSGDVDPTRMGFNSFGHPMSLHPGGDDRHAPDPNLQTTRIFDGEDWLDHHWIQSYAETDKIVYRVSELRGMIPGGLTSHLPVLLAEPSYEGGNNGRYTDWDHGTGAAKEASKARRQGWLSMFAGAAGHVYGAEGIWEATDPENLNFAGSGKMHHIKDFLLAQQWPSLTPAACVEVRAGSSWNPPALDYPSNANDTAAVLAYTYAPRCLMNDGHTYAAYIPAGNDGKSIRLVMLAGNEYRARWFDPRDGTYADINGGNTVNSDHDDRYTVPSRPSPSSNDWVIVLNK